MIRPWWRRVRGAGRAGKRGRRTAGPAAPRNGQQRRPRCQLPSSSPPPLTRRPACHATPTTEQNELNLPPPPRDSRILLSSLPPAPLPFLATAGARSPIADRGPPEVSPSRSPGSTPRRNKRHIDRKN